MPHITPTVARLPDPPAEYDPYLAFTEAAAELKRCADILASIDERDQFHDVQDLAAIKIAEARSMLQTMVLSLEINQ